MLVIIAGGWHPNQFVDRAAVVRFVKRNSDLVDVERVETPLGPALVGNRGTMI